MKSATGPATRSNTDLWCATCRAQRPEFYRLPVSCGVRPAAAGAIAVVIRAVLVFVTRRPLSFRNSQ
jgi:hypothetical protein